MEKFRPVFAAGELWQAAIRAALPAGGKLYFGTFPSELRPEHVTPEAMAVLARWVDNRHIVPQGYDDGIVVNLPQRRLFLFRNGALKHSYPVAVGSEGWKTPVGDFVTSAGPVRVGR